MLKINLIIVLLIVSLNIIGQSSPDLIEPPLWTYTVMGNDIGLSSMYTLDIDNDGIIETICSADKNGGYWYILEHDSLNSQYKITWTSNFSSYQITSIVVFDPDKDGIFTIGITYSNGYVVFYDGRSLEKTGDFFAATQIYLSEYGDADNDGNDEILILIYNRIILLNNLTFEEKGSFNIDDVVSDFEIGNVGNDNRNEIVLSSGKVLEYKNGLISTLWDLQLQGREIELSDVDHDNRKEIITAYGFYNIRIYDAETKNLKLDISTEYNPGNLLLQDINHDNTDEIIYSDQSLHCYNYSTRKELWEIPNPWIGVNNINVADVDGNDTLEVIWGAGWMVAGKNILYIANMINKNIIWESTHIDGPFCVVRIGDVDDDNEDEIVAVANASNDGMDGSVLFVFNAQTKTIEWQSDIGFLGYWGINNLELTDIDQDGETEIVIGERKIWVINGRTKVIESSHEGFFNEKLSGIESMAIDDINSDGIKEYIAADGNNLAIINSQTYEIEWNLALPQGGDRPSRLKIENIDSDSSKEIILCENFIYVIDAATKQVRQTVGSFYAHFDLYDTNSDGNKEIVAADMMGNIEIFDGELNQLHAYKVSDERLYGIKVTDLNKDSKPEFIAATYNKLIFIADTANKKASQEFGNGIAGHEGFITYDLDKDGKEEIIFSTFHQLIVLSSKTYACLWNDLDFFTVDPDCRGNNGSITMAVRGGAAPYQYDLNNAITDSVIFNLAPGTYYLTATDQIGCQEKASVHFKQPKLITDLTVKNITCNENGNGSAFITINEGTLPVSYQWSTGDTTANITNLTSGGYWVKTVDAKYCIVSDTFNILKDSLEINYMKENARCNGSSTGYILIFVENGEYPIQYSWSNGSTQSSIYELSAGSYHVEIVDSRNCVDSETFIITEPDKMDLSYFTTPDDPNTLTGEGNAEITEVLGGMAPYFYFWNDPLMQRTPNATNLHAGTYIVAVSDAVGCMVLDTIEVGMLTDIHAGIINKEIIYPNPAKDKLNISLTGAGLMNIEISDESGTPVKRTTHNFSEQSTMSLDLGFMLPGSYVIKLYSTKVNIHYKLLIIK